MKLFNPPIGAGRVCLHVDGARAELSLFTSISFLACVEERERKGKDFYMFCFFIPNHLVRFPAVRHLISFRIDRRPSPFDRVRCDENGGPCQRPFTLRLTPTLDEFLTSLGPEKI